MVRSAPPEIWRARWAASRTRSNLFGILSTQSSTVTRAIGRSAKLFQDRNMGFQEGGANSSRAPEKSRKVASPKRPWEPDTAVRVEQRSSCVTSTRGGNAKTARQGGAQDR